jgi:DNA modification methylase
MYKTAKAFPPGPRPEGVGYNYLLLASRMARKFPELRMQPLAALDAIRQLRLSQHRDVARCFAEMARASKLARLSGRFRQELIDSDAEFICHARFQDLLHRIPDHAAKIIHIDPPYVYPNLPGGKYGSASSRSRICDNDIADHSIALTIDLLGDWQPKLAPGGVLLLWQPSSPLNRSIMDAIEKFGWALERPVIWDKGRVQPGSFDRPYCTQTEMLWVLSRLGDQLVNHDDSARNDILRFSPVSHPGKVDQLHCFEKPQPLCEFLIRKHSHPGELVLDLCGCTGSMSLAAIAANRRWVYVESNPDNFRLGASRIAKQLSQR